MNKEILLTRFIELLAECDEWIKLNSSAGLNYYLEFTPKGIFASFDVEESKPNLNYNFKSRIFNTNRIVLPLKINPELIGILLDNLYKSYLNSLNLNNALTAKDIFVVSAYLGSYNQKFTKLEVRVKFTSTIERLKGIVNVKTCSNRFIVDS